MSVPLIFNAQESAGVEMPQIRAAVQIRQNIDAALKLQSDRWDAIDRSVAVALDQPYRRCVLERPPKGAIYPGTRAGVLDMPWDRFPAVCTMVDRATPTAESARFDQGSSAYAIQLYVEAVVRSDAFRVKSAGEPEILDERIAQEGLVDQRAKRTLEALVHCIAVDPSLGGSTLPLADPTLSQTDAFTLGGEEPGDKTLRRVFCYVRAQYSLASYSTHFDASKPPPSILAALGLGG